MLTNQWGVIKPLEVKPESFFTNKKHGKHYYEKSTKDINLLNYDFEFIISENNLRPCENPNILIEDVEKTLNFLNNTQYLELVCVIPTYKFILDFLHRWNIYDSGKFIIKSNTSRRIQGKIETSKFDIILSKEISINFEKKCDNLVYLKDRHIEFLYKDILIDKKDFYSKECSSKDCISYSIHEGISNMSRYSPPNTILLPYYIYHILFFDNLEYDEKESSYKFLTKTENKLFDIDVWINPHSNNIILYKNNYINKEFDKTNIENCFVFSPMCLFSKKPNNIITDKYYYMYNITELSKIVGGLDENFYAIYIKDKYENDYQSSRYEISKNI